MAKKPQNEVVLTAGQSISLDLGEGVRLVVRADCKAAEPKKDDEGGNGDDDGGGGDTGLRNQRIIETFGDRVIEHGNVLSVDSGLKRRLLDSRPVDIAVRNG